MLKIATPTLFIISVLLICPMASYADTNCKNSDDVVFSAVSEQLGLPVNQLKDDRLISEYGADDLDVVELVMTIEENLGIAINDESISIIEKSNNLTTKMLQEQISEACKKSTSDPCDHLNASDEQIENEFIYWKKHPELSPKQVGDALGCYMQKMDKLSKPLLSDEQRNKIKEAQERLEKRQAKMKIERIHREISREVLKDTYKSRIR